MFSARKKNVSERRMWTKKKKKKKIRQNIVVSDFIKNILFILLYSIFYDETIHSIPFVPFSRVLNFNLGFSVEKKNETEKKRNVFNRNECIKR